MSEMVRVLVVLVQQAMYDELETLRAELAETKLKLRELKSERHIMPATLYEMDLMELELAIKTLNYAILTESVRLFNKLEKENSREN